MISFYQVDTAEAMAEAMVVDMDQVDMVIELIYRVNSDRYNY